MFPPPPVEGAVVPGGMMPWRQLRLGCHPPGLFERLQALPGFNPREMLDMELEIKAIDGCPEDEHAEFVELHIRREQRWAEVLRYLMDDRTGRPDGGHVRRRRQAPAPVLALHRSRLPARSSPNAWEQQMIELCEQLLPLARRADRGDRRARRARRDRRARLRSRLRPDPGRVPRQLVARAERLPRVGRPRTGADGRSRAPTSASPR